MPFIGKSPGSPSSSRHECDKHPDEVVPVDSPFPAVNQPGDANNVPESPPVLISDSDKRTLQRLVGSSVPQDELPSLIKIIVSNVNPTEIAKCLERSDAQTFIDVVDQVCDTTTLRRNSPIVNPPLFRL